MLFLEIHLGKKLKLYPQKMVLKKIRSFLKPMFCNYIYHTNQFSCKLCYSGVVESGLLEPDYLSYSLDSEYPGDKLLNLSRSQFPHL